MGAQHHGRVGTGRNVHRGRLNRLHPPQKVPAKRSWRAQAYIFYNKRQRTNTPIVVAVTLRGTLGIQLVVQPNSKLRIPGGRSGARQRAFPVDPCLTKRTQPKKVWFPTTDNGEPHVRNPDDGFGGSVFQLNTVVHIYYYSPDGETVLEGKQARDAAREERVAKNKTETSDLVYREFHRNVQAGGCGSDWGLFEKKIDLLEEPCWSIIGQLWRSMNGDQPRLEEEHT